MAAAPPVYCRKCPWNGGRGFAMGYPPLTKEPANSKPIWLCFSEFPCMQSGDLHANRRISDRVCCSYWHAMRVAPSSRRVWHCQQTRTALVSWPAAFACARTATQVLQNPAKNDYDRGDSRHTTTYMGKWLVLYMQNLNFGDSIGSTFKMI